MVGHDWGRSRGGTKKSLMVHVRRESDRKRVGVMCGQIELSSCLHCYTISSHIHTRLHSVLVITLIMISGSYMSRRVAVI